MITKNEMEYGCINSDFCMEHAMRYNKKYSRIRGKGANDGYVIDREHTKQAIKDFCNNPEMAMRCMERFLERYEETPKNSSEQECFQGKFKLLMEHVMNTVIMDMGIGDLSDNADLPIDYVRNMETQPPELCKKYLERDPSFLKYIKDQSLEMCEIAFESHSREVSLIWDKYYENEDKNKKLYKISSLMEFDSPLKHVRKQTPEICLAAVKKDGMALEYVKNRTPEICLAAVKNYGFALRYVNNPTFEICMAAVMQDGNALAFIEDQNDEICLAAVKRHAKALVYVINQTPEICLAAVNEDWETLQFVRDQTPEICMAAIKNDYNALNLVRKQTYEICLAAVKLDGRALCWVQNQTPEICKAAINNDPRVIIWVVDKDMLK